MRTSTSAHLPQSTLEVTTDVLQPARNVATRMVSHRCPIGSRVPLSHFVTPLKGESSQHPHPPPLHPPWHMWRFFKGVEGDITWLTILSSAAIAIRQGFARVIIVFDMEAVLLRFIINSFYVAFPAVWCWFTLAVKWFSFENTLFPPKFLPLTLLWFYTEVRSSKWAWLKFRCCIQSCPQFQLKRGPM